MKDLKTLETQVLIDVLARETVRYTHRITLKNGVELTQSEYEIALIQGELNSRKMGRKNISARDSLIKLRPYAKPAKHDERNN